VRPTIGITAGDPAGIGLEVVLKALPQVSRSARWLLFTTRRTFEKNSPSVPFRWIRAWDELAERGDGEELLVFSTGDGNPLIGWGETNSACGAEALHYLQVAAEAALTSRIQGLVTAPVNKYAIELAANSRFEGQTEFLAKHANSAQFAMAFFAPTFKVVLATVHLSLRDALAGLSQAKYTDLIRFVDRQMQRFRFPAPRIAVAAINPHAGEHGMFGDDDDRLIAPAVKRCAAEGISVSGPHSADSLYYRAHRGEFDVVIAPYHDQGLIPVKLIAHGDSINVTLGLPYVRTSPDHGTAFPIAGKGAADAAGMLSAMKCAVDLVARLNTA
jgi:4-hydroxythreonine-4-phosphate dehydrogenase